MGLLANVGIRHGHFEFQGRLKGGLGSSGKIAHGAGLDYFFFEEKIKERTALNFPPFNLANRCPGMERQKKVLDTGFSIRIEARVLEL